MDFNITQGKVVSKNRSDKTLQHPQAQGSSSNQFVKNLAIHPMENKEKAKSCRIFKNQSRALEVPLRSKFLSSWAHTSLPKQILRRKFTKACQEAGKVQNQFMKKFSRNMKTP